MPSSVIAIRGRKYRLWRAVDQEDAVLDFPAQRRRCANSAERLLRRLLKKQGYAPTRIVTDKLKSCPAAIRKMMHVRRLLSLRQVENLSHDPGMTSVMVRQTPARLSISSA